jgi:hypothetical protein
MAGDRIKDEFIDIICQRYGCVLFQVWVCIDTILRIRTRQRTDLYGDLGCVIGELDWVSEVNKIIEENMSE